MSMNSAIALAESPAGHRIPPELIAHTMFLVMKELSDEGAPFMKPVDREFQRWLGTCTLVCRYWASLLRKILFSRVQLRCEDDLNGLLGLLSTPGPAIPALKDCLQMIIVSQQRGWEVDSQAPWYHRLSNIQTHASNSLTWAMAVHGVVDRNVVDYRFLAGPLPRTLPGSVFRVDHLFLSYVRLRSVRDLVRAVGALHGLSVLQCTRLLFDDREIPTERVLASPPRAREDGWDLTVQVQRSGGADVEKKLMLKLVSELHYTTPNSAPLWGTFSKLVMAFKVPALTEANIFAATDSCLFSDEVYGSFMLPMALTVAEGAAVLWTIDDGQKFIPPETPAESGDWYAFENALISKGIPLSMKIDDVAGCRTMLDAVFVGGLFSRLLDAGMLALEHKTYLPRDIFAQRARWRIDGRDVVLKPSQQLDLLLCRDQGEKLAYVRKVVIAQLNVK